MKWGMRVASSDTASMSQVRGRREERPPEGHGNQRAGRSEEVAKARGEPIRQSAARVYRKVTRSNGGKEVRMVLGKSRFHEAPGRDCPLQQRGRYTAERERAAAPASKGRRP